MDAPSLTSRLNNQSVNRICVIKPSAFGDVVQCLSLLPVLKSRFPSCSIQWVINRGLIELVSEHPDLDQIIPFERNGGLRSWWTLLRNLRSQRFDLVLDLQGLARTGLMTLATRAPLRVGLQTAREGSHLACHYLIPDSGPLVPASLRYWRVAELLGLSHLNREAHLVIPEETSAWARRIQQRMSGPILLLHPGARWESKRWPIRSFAEIAYRSIKNWNMSVIVVGGREETSDGEELLQQVRRVLPHADMLNLAGQTSIKQLAALVQIAKIVLSNDSGPMHLADGLGTPVVGVFTCTDPQKSGPSLAPHRSVSAHVPCAGSYCKTCPKTGDLHMACMTELQPDRVWTAMQSLMQEGLLLRKSA